MSKTIRRTAAILLALLMLLGAAPLIGNASGELPVAALGNPEVNGISGSGKIQIRYRSTLLLKSTLPVNNWALSKADGLSIKNESADRKQADLVSARGSRGNKTAVLTVQSYGDGSDPNDITTITVEVKTVWWQWLIIIFLFGFIWY